MSVKEIKIDKFDYSLPDDRIPTHPLSKRDECNLLVSAPERTIYHRKFKELPDLLPPGTLLVVNDTKVINARLTFKKSTGAYIEIFLLDPVTPADYEVNFQQRQRCTWRCLVGNLKKWKEGALEMKVQIEEDSSPVTFRAEHRGSYPETGELIEFSWDNEGVSFARIIETAGIIPIPPYLNRDSEESDLSDYQTVYARLKGSVAAPTAGLHFTPEVFDGLKAHAIPVDHVTLHVGAGTFRPVKSEEIGGHGMHSEPFTVSHELLDKLIDRLENSQIIVAVGTTSVRTLESLPYIGYALMSNREAPLHVNQWDPYSEDSSGFSTIEALKALRKYMMEENLDNLTASTSIMIAPGFKWRITGGMVTNFHQPKSTLLLLVSSFLGGGDEWKEIYNQALEKEYRFLSYGDACLLFKTSSPDLY